MQIKLSPSWYLTDAAGAPRLFRRSDPDRTYSPDEILQLYPSWPLQPCRQSVRRAAATLQLTPEESDLVSRFCGPGRPTTGAATGHIHLRVTMERKNDYVRVAKLAGKNLSDWITDTCDSSASGYPARK